jgi:hypothetical protein
MKGQTSEEEMMAQMQQQQAQDKGQPK